MSLFNKIFCCFLVKKFFGIFIGGLFYIIGIVAFSEESQSQHQILEEVIVTAQKRERSLQDTSIAISTLSAYELENQDIRGLAQLDDGAVPSLRVMTHIVSPSTLTVSIRGNGPSDSIQITRDGSVAFYLDGIYIGRGQGLAFEQADLERIEVLRGPQGTLSGRNATGGAINLLSKKPIGEFDFKQAFMFGRFDEFRSVTHLNLPAIAGINAKLDLLHSERDGWVNNTALGEVDYNYYNSTGGRLSLNSQVSDELEIDYTYDQSKLKASQVYLQLYQDNIGAIGVDIGRQDQTRFPIIPLSPTITEQKGHALTASWQSSDHLTVKSLTSYRDLKEDTSNNYAGVLYANGLMILEDTSHNQLSQEFQLIGLNEQFEWVAGFYYYKERASEDLTNVYTLDIFGCLTGTPGSPIPPTTTFPLCNGPGIPGLTTFINARSESRAVYGQATWVPPILDERMNISIGLRYTEDKKSGSRRQAIFQTYDLKTQNTNPALTVDYAWSDNLKTYAKWSTAYRAGGANLRSASFDEYGEEEAKAFELGLKSEFWDNRLRLNTAVFSTDYDGMQLDVSDPNNITILETINTANTVEVDGVEIDIDMLLAGWQLGIYYTYLDSEMPLQPNPLAGGALESFTLPQAPKHAGALTADYIFAPTRFGTFIANINMTSTSQYAYFPSSPGPFDSYTLWNARLSLVDIPLGGGGQLKISAWTKNLTDEEYVISSFVVGSPVVTIAQAFGTPRTFGIDLSYQL